MGTLVVSKRCLSGNAALNGLTQFSIVRFVWPKHT
jgi:hypothetical protein